MGPIEHESLAALAERGFRFSMDQVSDLRMEPSDLSDRGIRFVKVPGGAAAQQGGARRPTFMPPICPICSAASASA